MIYINIITNVKTMRVVPNVYIKKYELNNKLMRDGNYFGFKRIKISGYSTEIFISGWFFSVKNFSNETIIFLRKNGEF